MDSFIFTLCWSLGTSRSLFNFSWNDLIRNIFLDTRDLLGWVVGCMNTNCRVCHTLSGLDIKVSRLGYFTPFCRSEAIVYDVQRRLYILSLKFEVTKISELGIKQIKFGEY